MSDSLDEKCNDRMEKLAAERRDRIRKMRGWLSPRDTIADDFGPEDAALYYQRAGSGLPDCSYKKGNRPMACCP